MCDLGLVVNRCPVTFLYLFCFFSLLSFADAFQDVDEGKCQCSSFSLSVKYALVEVFFLAHTHTHTYASLE